MMRKPISFGRKLSRLVSAVSRLLAMFTAAKLVMNPCLEFGGRAAPAWRAGASHRVPGFEPSKRADTAMCPWASGRSRLGQACREEGGTRGGEKEPMGKTDDPRAERLEPTNARASTRRSSPS